MKQSHGMFTSKLNELKQQYVQLQSRIKLCQKCEHDQILEEIEKIKHEWLENDLQLQSTIDSSRSPAVSKLAKVQLDYSKKTIAILQKEHTDSQDESNLVSEDSESSALYAEYAIDFATQAIRHALLASLSAISIQLTEEENQEKKKEI